LGKKGICANITMLTFLVHESTQYSICINTKAHDDNPLPIAMKVIVGFISLCIMVGKFVKVLVDMAFGIPKIIPKITAM
jgi:hypothetical protein